MPIRSSVNLVRAAIGVVRTYKKGKRGYEVPLLMEAYHAVAIRGAGNLNHEQAIEQAMSLIKIAAEFETATEENEHAAQATTNLLEHE